MLLHVRLWYETITSKQNMLSNCGCVMRLTNYLDEQSSIVYTSVYANIFLLFHHHQYVMWHCDWLMPDEIVFKATLVEWIIIFCSSSMWVYSTCGFDLDANSPFKLVLKWPKLNIWFRLVINSNSTLHIVKIAKVFIFHRSSRDESKRLKTLIFFFS